MYLKPDGEAFLRKTLKDGGTSATEINGYVILVRKIMEADDLALMRVLKMISESNLDFRNSLEKGKKGLLEKLNNSTST
jgi:hypothetical protein